MFSDIKIGDTVFKVYDDSRRGMPSTVEVVSIGTKWITCADHSRFERSTGAIDGGRNYCSLGRVYRNEQEYKDSILLNDAYKKMRLRFECMDSMNLTMVDIDRISAILDKKN